MNRSRLVIAASTFIVAAGALTAVGALYMDPARAAVGPLPAEGLALPADAQFVMGIDVRRFVASPFYTRFSEQGGQARPQAFAEMEAKTGINPERDVDAIYVAGRKGTSGKRHDGDGVVIVTGTFDRYKVQRAIETAAQKGMTSASHLGTPMYVFNEESRPRQVGRGGLPGRPHAGDGLAHGGRAVHHGQVRGQGRAARQRGDDRAPRERAPGLDVLDGRRPVGAGADAEGHPRAGRVRRGHRAAAAEDRGGDRRPGPDALLRGHRRGGDAAAAQNLADVVRGLLAFANLQAAQRPELKQLASAVSITTDANKVRIAGRFPYEMLEALRAQKAARADVTAP